MLYFESFAQETVDRGFKNSSFHALSIPVSKELWRTIHQSFWRVFSSSKPVKSVECSTKNLLKMRKLISLTQLSHHNAQHLEPFLGRYFNIFKGDSKEKTTRGKCRGVRVGGLMNIDILGASVSICPQLYEEYGFTRCLSLHSVKIVRLAPPPPLFNVRCKFACSFLVSTSLHGFFRLGTTLSQREGVNLGNFKQV